MKTDPNESAHPFVYETCSPSENVNVLSTPGLTKREYFAAMAMQGLLANPGDCSPEQVVMSAVGYAERLVEALNKDAEPIPEPTPKPTRDPMWPFEGE